MICSSRVRFSPSWPNCNDTSSVVLPSSCSRQSIPPSASRAHRTKRSRKVELGRKKKWATIIISNNTNNNNGDGEKFNELRPFLPVLVGWMVGKISVAHYPGSAAQCKETNLNEKTKCMKETIVSIRKSICLTVTFESRNWNNLYQTETWNRVIYHVVPVWGILRDSHHTIRWHPYPRWWSWTWAD